jgi:hypothetical protein
MTTRPYFYCRTCGFKRSHRHMSVGLDGFLAKWRVQLHMWLRGHRSAKASR